MIHHLMGILSCAKYSMTMSKNKKPIARTKTCQKRYEFHPEVQGQRNVRNTSSHGDKLMCI